ncbi:MAG: deoxyribodipyrimidine photo-lyase, partial [Acidobacteria bacterium]|nr:deoxyribodipyrimidine photo-lyase [Acidobacteriota bacterium]
MKELLKNERFVLRNGFEIPPQGDCVLYVMQRSQRPFDNPALNASIKIANELGLPVKVVVFVLKYPRANIRHYKFFLDGLMDVAKGLLSRGISFQIKLSEEFDEILKDVISFNPKVVLADENPLREMENLRENLSNTLKVPFVTVDGDVVVPSKLIGKEVYNAKILKSKMQELLPDFLKKEDELGPKINSLESKETRIFTLDEVRKALNLDYSVNVVSKKGGYFEALRALRNFVKNKLKGYDKKRNDPNEDWTSGLSPYLHFGHISPITVAFEALSSSAPSADIEAFLDQLIVRRELAINYVKYNKNYDNLKGCENWALKTLDKHKFDFRDIHTISQLENCETKDPLWNAATRQMKETGFMHNYLRMYWAKQILFWTKSPEEAFEYAVYLNDKYLLDGRDANGYAGIAWAIGAKHDRPFPPDKPIIGLVRPMTLNGAKRKFDVEKFNRQVITENFNRTVLEEIAKELNPEGEGKTLIYAVDD